MRLDVFKNGSLVVVLSERNLLSLLAKLHDPQSLKTLFTHTPQGLLSVKGEYDEEHYKDRLEPGRMYPPTEAAIVRMTEQKKGAGRKK